jgi:hypothetical protein
MYISHLCFLDIHSQNTYLCFLSHSPPKPALEQFIAYYSSWVRNFQLGLCLHIHIHCIHIEGPGASQATGPAEGHSTHQS